MRVLVYSHESVVWGDKYSMKWTLVSFLRIEMDNSNKSLKRSKRAAARLKLGESELRHFFAGEQWESEKINIH